MIIRLATFDDGPRLCEMAARFLETTAYAQLVVWEPEPLANLVYAVLEQGVIYVAEELAEWAPGNDDSIGDAEPIGMIALVARPHVMNSTRYGDELAWWVEPAHRGGEAATLLLDRAEQWARENGLSVLKMSAPAGSMIGRLYERRGYVLLESTYQKTL